MEEESDSSVQQTETNRKRRARFVSSMRMRKFRAMKKSRRNRESSTSSSSSSIENNPPTTCQPIRENISGPESNGEEEINVAHHVEESENSLRSSVEADFEDNRIDHLSPQNLTTSDQSNSSVSTADSDNASEVSYMSEATTSIDSAWSEESIASNILISQEVVEVREWAIEINLCHEYLNKLLTILRRRVLPELQKTAKTLLGTSSAQYRIVEMEDANGNSGQFVYFTLRKGIERCVDPKTHTSDVIELIINADGVPLTKSGAKQMWVLAAKIHFNIDIYKPFPVAIFYGCSKPVTADAFLDEFILEMNSLYENGINISGRHFQVRLKCFICDTPARAFLKCTVGHTAKNACERCTVYGRKVNNTTIYPSTDSQERTNESFRAMSQEGHHHTPSPLLRINPPIDMVFQFILDFMHLCLLGVMKRLMEWWMEGDLNVRLGYRLKQELSKRLESLKQFVPKEFQRKPRSVKFLARWKATEFRFMLLYCGPAVLKNVLPTRLYKHFLLFHVACRILSCERLCLSNFSQAKQLLVIFFKVLPGFYGPKSQILNFHHLIHFPDDIERMLCSVSRITAFPFESLLGKMKKKIRTALRPLAQLCRRLHEEYFLKDCKATAPPEIVILNSHGDAHLEIKFKQYFISSKSPDNLISLKNGEIFKIEKISGPIQSLVLAGKMWRKKKSMFNYPCDSSVLHMWELEKEPTKDVESLSITLFDRKMCYLPVDVNANGITRMYAVPFLH